jgi:Virulence activator alpha C-term
VQAQIHGRRARAVRQLHELEEVERRIDRESDFFPYLTLLHGLEDARSTVTWCDRALAELTAREARRARS